MQYTGGKSRISQYIVPFLQPAVQETGGCYVEPFVGGASIMSRVRGPHRFAFDANQALITMWRAVLAGWDPPEQISESQYVALKARQDPDNPLTAFVGFGCSFGGKWFAGYARNGRAHYYARESRNSVLRKARGLQGVFFGCADYRQIVLPDRATVYCDPPYEGRHGYGATGPFNTAAFWDWCRNRAAEGHMVFVSELNAPPDFVEVWRKPAPKGLRSPVLPRRVERLFVFKGQT